MRFSYATTLAYEKYGMIVLLWIPILSCAIADSFNPFFHSSEILYYAINIGAFLFGYSAALVLNGNLVEWMRERTIWSSEWESEYGECQPFIEKPTKEKVTVVIAVLKLVGIKIGKALKVILRYVTTVVVLTFSIVFRLVISCIPLALAIIGLGVLGLIIHWLGWIGG
ncbi:hypothetical protein Aeroheme_01440 [Aeromonas sp. DSM 116730]|uniref:hypothetical protein n=1 Tax=Aeromonas sp. DSM 116730 TaxID=3115851 RepID=UPI003981C43B